MKGIAHFATGLCVASFVPGVVEDAATGGLLIALGGACGMLPDLLDFRFAKFLEKHDADIAPDAAQPDPQAMADAIAYQLYLAEQSPRIVQLHPLRRGVVDWVTYTVQFDGAMGDVVVTLNDGAQGRAHAGNFNYAYDGALDVGELGGPSLKFVSIAGGKVTVEFLPWHRTWSHSLLLALALGVLMGLWLGPMAGWAAGLAFAAHVLEDQLGYMGSNLFWPVTRSRSNGLKLMHSGDAIPNLVTVWLCLTLILLNLDRIRLVPLIATGPFLAFAVLLPCAAAIAIYTRRRWRVVAHTFAADQNRDAVDEAEVE